MANQKQRAVYEEQGETSGTPMKILSAVVLFGAAVLFTYITVAPPTPGTAMSAIRDILRGLCGNMSLLFSLILIWIGVLLIFSARGKRVRVLNIILNSLLFLCIFTAVQLFSTRTVMEEQMSITSFANFVNKSYLYARGGGAIGALLAYPLYLYLGQWGGLIVVALVCLLCLLATGRAQQLYRWASRRADEGQHRMQQRRNRRDVERMFEYDEYDAPAPRRPVRQEVPQGPLKREPRPLKAVKPSKDYMVIGSTAARRGSSKAAGTPAPQAQDAPRKETNAPERRSAAAQPEMEIPKSLRKLRQERQAAQTEEKRTEEKHAGDRPNPAPEAEGTQRKKNTFPRDIPDFFSVQPDEGEESAVQEESEAQIPPKPASSVKPKRVVEGVRALDREDEPAPEEEEDDGEAPFDIPHLAEKRSNAQSGGARGGANSAPEAPEEDYNYPPIDLLQAGEQVKNTNAHKEADRQKAEKLISTLDSFGIETRLIGIAHGPAVTRFELQPAPGVKVSRITALADDIALGLAALSVRIEAPIPGKAAVGVEIPNDKVEMVRLREVLESPEARRHPSKIAVGLGKDNSGRYIVGDIAKMPHVLIAGQTGSGKSVCINSIITSILYRATPEEVRMILIDPKVVELSIYNDIPHLIAPVVTDPKKASSALEWAVAEMSTRYKRFAERGVRDIKGYNKTLEPGEKRMPQMVIIIDELADLMMVAPGEVEDSICRLAQLARAAGMHLVIATQRPSVNVITGVIKANIPTRIAFSVASQVDSRTMIDHGGAEKLLGNGDMLFVPSGINKPIRVQGAWVSDDEVHAIVSYIKARTETTYDEDVVEKIENSIRSDAEREEVADEYDPKLEEAVEIVIEAGQASVSMLQRRMRVGYARAGRLIDEMERRGIVSEADGAKPRTVLISREQFQAMFGENEM